MTISPYEIDRIRELPLFAGLGAEALQGVLSDAVVRVRARRTRVFNQGDPVTHFFVVLTGWVKLYRVDPNGGEMVLEIFGPWESFAEGALYHQDGYPANAEMIEDGRLLEIPTASFLRRLRSDPDLALNILSTMAIRMKGFIRRIEQTGRQSTPQRVGAFLLKYCPASADGAGPCEVKLPYDKQLIAKRLDMKPESFSRAVAKLREQGVNVKGQVAKIEDVPRLRGFVDD